jgi:hypothetical protein
MPEQRLLVVQQGQQSSKAIWRSILSFTGKGTESTGIKQISGQMCSFQQQFFSPA